MKKILVFEPLVGGHRAHFLDCVKDGILNSPPPHQQFIFVVAETNAETGTAPIRYDTVPDNEFRDCTGMELKWNLWRCLKRKCREHLPDEVMLMDLTQLEWAMVFMGLAWPCSAILFVQYPELRWGIKKWVKELKTSALIARTELRTVFLLNGGYSVRYLEEKFPGKVRFLAVPDPLEPLPAGREISPPQRWSKTVFLYFGAISLRKGFGLLVEALLTLTPEELKRMKFLFCGLPEDPVYFEVLLKRLQRTGLPIDLEVTDRFLPHDEMISRFLGADVVLMPYLRPEYSSGVLGIAAQTLRPVIGPDRGLLGRLIREHGLGKTCKMRPRTLARALVEATEPGVEFNRETAEAFVARSSENTFAMRIIDALQERSET